MITCREIASGTRRNSADGEPTKNPAIVPTPSLKLFRPRNWRQFFHRDDEIYVAKATVLLAPAMKTQQPLVPLVTRLFRTRVLPTVPPLPCGIIVWLWCFLRRPLFFGDMTQVDADACPRG